MAYPIHIDYCFSEAAFSWIHNYSKISISESIFLNDGTWIQNKFFFHGQKKDKQASPCLSLDRVLPQCFTEQIHRHNHHCTLKRLLGHFGSKSQFIISYINISASVSTIFTVITVFYQRENSNFITEWLKSFSFP